MAKHNEQTLKRTLLALIPLLLVVLLSGCMSLAEDITPPPGAQVPVTSRNTPTPRPTATPVSLVYPEFQPDPNNGALIYAEKCASCHGDTGQGDGINAAILEDPIPALGTVELARQSTPAAWYLAVSGGSMQKFMPAFTSLSDQERWDVVAYLYTLSTSPEELTQGENLFAQNCSQCHGEDGQGNPSTGAADLTNPATMWERSADALYQTISTGGQGMPAFSRLSEADRWTLTTFVRSLTFAPYEESAEAEVSAEQATPAVEATPAEAESSSPAEEATQALEPGTVQLTVVHVEGGDLPENLDITLRGYDQMTEAYTQTVTLSTGITATFHNVPMPVGRVYFATAEYQNAAYGSNLYTIDSEDVGAFTLTMNFFPPTNDPSILKVDRLHVFLDFVEEGMLEVLQLYIFSNPSNRILAPHEEGEPAIQFTLPADAVNLSVEEDDRLPLIRTAEGFGVINVFPDPNPYQVLYSYQIPYDGGKLDLEIPIDLDAQAVILLAPEDGLKIKSDTLEDAGTEEFQGVRYKMLTGSNLQTGTPLALTLSGRPKAKADLIAGSDSTSSLVIGLAGFGLALIGAGTYLWWRNRQLEEEWEESEEGEVVEVEFETPDEVIDAIIALDDQYKTGGLPEGAYRVRRAELKERLKELVSQ